MSNAANHPQSTPATAAVGPSAPAQNRRLMQSLGASVAAAGLVWVLFNHNDLTPITPTPQAADRPPAHANLQPPTTLAPAAPTTTAAASAPTTTAAPTTTTAAAAAVPAGAHPSPEEAAQAWWSHRVKVPTGQVMVHQRDRRDRDTFRVLVSATKGPDVPTGLLRVVRIGGNYWRCEGFYQEAS